MMGFPGPGTPCIEVLELREASDATPWALARLVWVLRWTRVEVSKPVRRQQQPQQILVRQQTAAAPALLSPAAAGLCLTDKLQCKV
jgi:hypothetical protein